MLELKKFLKNEDGATAIEYGLIAALISVALIGAVTSVGSSIPRFYNEVAEKIGAVTNDPS